LGQVIYLPPFAISYEEARKNQLMQDQINEQRAKIRNWALTKSQYEIAQALLAWRKSFRSKIYIERLNQSNFEIHTLSDDA
jgi:hypothetical protein